MARRKQQVRGAKTKSFKTETLNRLQQEHSRLKQELTNVNETITTLEHQSQLDPTSQEIYNELASALQSKTILQAEIEIKEEEYRIIQTEPESSSDESKTSRLSGSPGAASSSGSSAPAILGWSCGCGSTNFNDPWGPDNLCTCGHEFCDIDTHCSVEWDPLL
ncbi:hypothetical protein F5Y10DRAFT_293598 [Nemania abortiva]|nr:hypothetical protein F5Y10DRAFT_293598 [Nemania abortiva]